MTEWKVAESNKKPDIFDTTSSKKVNYVRKDIVEIEREDSDGNTYTIYQYKERKVNKTEWNMYLSLVESQDALVAAEQTITDMDLKSIELEMRIQSIEEKVGE